MFEVVRQALVLGNGRVTPGLRQSALRDGRGLLCPAIYGNRPAYGPFTSVATQRLIGPSQGILKMSHLESACMSVAKQNRPIRSSVAGILILGSLAGATGCQVDVGGQTLPSPYYLQDDVQYFPAGPEFKLSREAAAMEAAKEAEASRRPGRSRSGRRLAPAAPPEALNVAPPAAAPSPADAPPPRGPMEDLEDAPADEPLDEEPEEFPLEGN